jgi:hypothetical protein
MKPPSRTQVRDRLGRFARAGRGPARLLVLAAHADLARRLWQLAVVAVVLAATVVLLYGHGDTVALERAAQAAAAAVTTAAHPSPPARAGADRARGPGRAASAPVRRDPGAGAAGRDTRGGAGQAGGPAAVAAAWYARQEGLEVSLVRSLQQDRVSGRQVRVLVLADRGRGRIDTALVTVRRDAAGRWAVR